MDMMLEEMNAEWVLSGRLNIVVYHRVTLKIIAVPFVNCYFYIIEQPQTLRTENRRQNRPSPDAEDKRSLTTPFSDFLG
jgi:hypothetical protein